MSARLPPDRLEAFAAEVLAAQGVLRDHASITAKRLIEGDLRGRAGHGIIRLPLYSERIRAGGYNLRPEVVVSRHTPVSALVDGDNGLGQVVMTLAAETAIEKAGRAGMAWVGTTRSNHAGAAGVYTAMAVAQGMIAFYFAVANANGMPPWGGREPILGTNPIAIGIPGGTHADFQLDIATTVASHGTIKVAAQAGEQMPEGWVVDGDGNPITDPSKAHEGFLVPIGGYKGAGLNIAIGLLAGVLNGAAFGRSVIDHREHPEAATNTGQAIFVMRPDLFADGDEFAERADRKLEELRHSESVSDAAVRLPGDTAAVVEEENRRLGIEIPDELLGRLRDLGSRLGVADPLAAVDRRR
jgi:L-2-hydroxycarboxylate dehydrogenase (NAD+)